MSFDSSVGRAVDCRGVEIHRSLVRIRLEGIFFCLKSIFFGGLHLTEQGVDVIKQVFRVRTFFSQLK